MLHNPKPPHHHSAPPGTSDEAAKRIAPHTSPQAQTVLRAIVEAGDHGLTDDEGQVITDVGPNSYPARRGELRRAGLILLTEHRRPTRSGCNAAVWVATNEGVAYLEGLH